MKTLIEIQQDENNRTFERLKLKVENDKNRMPSIQEIHLLLNSLNICHELREKTNIVEYRSKGNRYVNSRHNGKKGLELTIKEPYICLDSSDSYYSANSWGYAHKLVKLINQLNK